MKALILTALIVILCILQINCKRNDESTDKPIPILTGTVTDIDSNTYKTVKIGDQWWMAENLKTKRYLNGDSIPNIIDSLQWMNLTTGAYCNYANSADMGELYGYLYNWYSVNDSRNIAPEGWHIPNNDEWTTLLMDCDKDGYYVTSEGVDLKSLNIMGFNVILCGNRWLYGTFEGFSYRAVWWSSTEWDASRGSITIGGGTNNFVNDTFDPKSYGHSIRCVKD
jgi:uncharacterized protein (TIGR02145 family)